MSNGIRCKPEMTEANPYNDIKLLFCVTVSLLFLFVYKKIKKKTFFFKYELICATIKVVMLQRDTVKPKSGFYNKSCART